MTAPKNPPAGAPGRPVVRLADPQALRERHREHFAALRRLDAVYLGSADGRAQVGVAQPLDDRRAGDIAFVLGVPVDFFTVPVEDLRSFFDPPPRVAPGPGLRTCRFCGRTSDASRFLDDLGTCPGCAEAWLGVVWR